MPDRSPFSIRYVAGDICVFLFCWMVLAAIVSTDGPQLHVAELIGLGPSPPWRIVAALDSLVLMIAAAIAYGSLYLGLSGLSVFKGVKDLGTLIIMGLALLGLALEFAVHAGKCARTGNGSWIHLDAGQTASCVVSDVASYFLIIGTGAAVFLILLLLNRIGPKT